MASGVFYLPEKKICLWLASNPDGHIFIRFTRPQPLVASGPTGVYPFQKILPSLTLYALHRHSSEPNCSFCPQYSAFPFHVLIQFHPDSHLPNSWSSVQIPLSKLLLNNSMWLPTDGSDFPFKVKNLPPLWYHPRKGHDLQTQNGLYNRHGCNTLCNESVVFRQSLDNPMHLTLSICKIGHVPTDFCQG